MRIVGTRESRKRACEHPKARRAEVASARSKAQCAATEHRAAKGGTVRRCGTTMPNCGHGAKRSAQPRNTGPLKAARCEGAERPCRIVDTERSEVRRGETPGRRRRHGAKSEAAKRLKPRGHGAKRSPQGRNTGPPKTARCEIGGREAAEAPRTRSEAKSAGAKHRAAEDGTVRRCKTTIANCG